MEGIMLKAVKPNVTQVVGVMRQENMLVLDTNNGKIAIEICHPSIVRIMYTLEELRRERGIALSGKIEACRWTYEDEKDEVTLLTERLRIVVKKETGQIIYYRQDGQMLLAEKIGVAKELSAYESYKTIVSENSEVKRIQTPDGVKEVLGEGEKVFDKILYHGRIHFEWQEDEALYGMGQYEEGYLNLRGQRIYMHQANLKIAVPMMVSTQGYGLLFDCYSPMIFNDNNFGSYVYTEAVSQMDYYFIEGDSMDSVIGGYRYLTGKASMLPKWSFGFIQSLERYETGKELVDTVQEYRRREVPLDCIVLDWQSWAGDLWGQKTFDEERFGNPTELVRQLHDLNAHFMISIWPNMTRKSDNYKEMATAGCTLPQSEIYDAYRQEGRDLYWEQVNRGLFSHGIDAWWCDSSEPFTPEWNDKVRPEPDLNQSAFHAMASLYVDPEYTNAYGLFHGQGIYEGQRQVREDKRVVNLTRSGYIGQQKYGVILWSGDISASWTTLKKQIPAGLNLCASGLPYWTLDIGAFFVKQGEPWFWDGDYEDGNLDLGYRELYTRWYQLGAFLPIFRSHGTDTRREIWQFGEKGEMFYDTIKAFTELRYKLFPMIYSMAAGVHFRDETIMRVLAFDFPKDKNVYSIKDQYMFGQQMMVCPVCEPMYYAPQSDKIYDGEKTRPVYLPETSVWYDYWSKKAHRGGQSIVAQAPIEYIPVYVKGGSILVLGDVAQSSQDLDINAYQVEIYPGENCRFVLYLDEGDNYNFEKGACAFIEFVWDDQEQCLIIEKCQGSYTNMPETIDFAIQYIGGDMDVQNICYTGERKVITYA